MYGKGELFSVQTVETGSLEYLLQEALMDIDPFRYTPRYAPIEVWMALSGMTRSATEDALDRRDLRAIKVGTRKLIDVRRGLSWLGSLPDLLPKPGRRRTENTAIAA